MKIFNKIIIKIHKKSKKIMNNNKHIIKNCQIKIMKKNNNTH